MLRGGWPVVLILAAAFWVVSPVASAPTRLIPIRHNAIGTVPVFNAWTIWWNADQIADGYPDYWNAPIFWPHSSTFAWSEPQPLTAAVAPVVWLTGSPVAGYNLWLLLSLLGNGIATLCVLRRMKVSRSTATLVAVMMVWLPVNIRHMEVLQLIPIWPLIWTWDALRRWGRNNRWTSAAEVACAYTAAFYCSAHHTLFLSILLLMTAWPLIFAGERKPRLVLQALFSLVLAGIMVGIVAQPMQRELSGRKFERRRDLVTQLSVQPADLLQPPKDAYLLPTERRSSGRSPGWLKVALALLGIGLGLHRAKHRSWTKFLALTVLCSALLAMGPHLKFDGWVPWWWLNAWVPGLKLVRSVFRFTYFMQLAVVLLTAVGLHEIYVRVRASGRKNLALSVVWLAGLAALAELPVPRPLVAGLPDLSRHAEWADYLRQHVPPDRGIACLPFSASTRTRDFDVTVRWMYYGTQHKVPMVNGYSGFFPDDYLDLREDITQQGLTAEMLRTFYARKVSHLVLRRDYEFSSTLLNATDGAGLTRVYRDPTVQIDIYELRIGETHDASTAAN